MIAYDIPANLDTFGAKVKQGAVVSPCDTFMTNVLLIAVQQRDRHQNQKNHSGLPLAHGYWKIFLSP